MWFRLFTADGCFAMKTGRTPSCSSATSEAREGCVELVKVHAETAVECPLPHDLDDLSHAHVDGVGLKQTEIVVPTHSLVELLANVDRDGILGMPSLSRGGQGSRAYRP